MSKIQLSPDTRSEIVEFFCNLESRFWRSCCEKIYKDIYQRIFYKLGGYNEDGGEEEVKRYFSLFVTNDDELLEALILFFRQFSVYYYGRNAVVDDINEILQNARIKFSYYEYDSCGVVINYPDLTIMKGFV